MNASLPSALLRLREADIVRLCGFEAATRGMQLAGRQAVSLTRRNGTTLEASVTDEASLEVMAEIADGAPNLMLRWRCSAHSPADSTEGLPADGPGCEHVAALLTAWIRAPGDFAIPAQERSREIPQPPASNAQAIPPRLRQRPLSFPPQKADTSVTTSATLAGELSALPARELLAMAQRILGADLPESEARARLAQALADSARIQASLRRLSPHPRWLFGALLTLGGTITAADLESLAGRLGRASSALQADVESLTRHGLLFSVITPHTGNAAEEHSWKALAGWRIAPETRAAADGLYTLDFLLRGDESQRSLATAGWRVERSSPRELQLALALLARAPAPLGPLRSSAREGQRTRTEAAAQASLREGIARVPGDLAAGRLAELARAAGLEPGLTRMARRLLLWAREQSPGQPVLDLARLPQEERARALRQAFALWRETDSVAELVDLDLSGPSVRARVDTRHPLYSPAAIAAEVGAARRFLLALLARAQPGVWHTLDDLLTFIWRVRPGFLRGRQRAFAYPMWLLEQTEGDRRALHTLVESEWRAAEGVWIGALLSGPLRLWGALDIARDTSSHTAVAFRLTPFGAHLLDARAAPPHVAITGDWGPAILLTRDQSIAANPLSAGAELLDALAQWAYPASIAGGRLLYTLSPALAAAAFDHGLDPDALGERLRAADSDAAARIAAQIVGRLENWRQQYGRARIIEQVAALEARDEPTLAEALAYAPVIAGRARRIGPSAALLTPGDLAELRALLARKGYDL